MTLKKVKQLKFGTHAAVFSDSATKCMIEKLGEAALLSLYGCSEDNLNCVHYQKFCEKVATQSLLNPNAYLQHQVQPNIPNIVFVYIIKSSNGWENKI